MWNNLNKKLILASASPRRAQIMHMANLPFEVRPANIDESFPPDMPHAEVPVFLAKQKAQYLYTKLHPSNWIIAADTVVLLQNNILNKPADAAEAKTMLSQLSGRTHEVITGVAIQQANGNLFSFSTSTQVSFWQLSETQINYYIAQYQPFDKAGSYAIQEWIGAVGIKEIKGCYFNVMGLPVSRLVLELEILGWFEPNKE
ncbi:MAG: Maf family protein [Chitinophagales bacterium]|nr:septum formation protein Maf [Bacteroidota bacterium]MCB9042474.1 septum formation protein Maf [Chitinophagales bacterium]